MKLSRLLPSLQDKTIIITGSSRGIGRALALRCAQSKANIVLMARSASKPSHKLLHGHMNEVRSKIEEMGVKCLPIQVDLQDIDETHEAIEHVAKTFGRIDAVVNNASAIDISKTPDMNKYNLMMNINMRGTASMIASSYKYLLQSDLGHILSISPPLSTLSERWLYPHPAYTTSKYGMTMITLGYSDVLRANTLWPKKLIATASTKMLEEKTKLPAYSQGKNPDLFADTAYEILCSDVQGMSCLDDDIQPVGKGGVDDIFL